MPRTTPRRLGLAKALRRAMTEPERRLWQKLRAGRSGGKWRRQVPLGDYIADFACLDAGVIVEVDGSQHAESGRDRVRDAWLEEQGWRVVRVWNVEVMQSLEAVLDGIAAAVDEGRARRRMKE